MKFRSLLIVAVCLMVSFFKAQPKNFTQIEDAEEHFENGNFLLAIDAYRNELKKDPDRIDVKYKLGICYLNTRISREEAVTYLEEASRFPKTEAEVWLYLGKAYHLNNRLSEAISAYEKFKQLRPKFAAEADRYIDQSNRAIRAMQDSTNVTVQNLGPDINSEEPDYNPFIDANEMFLVFTSRRKENFGGKRIEVDGYRSSDIYQCVHENGGWSKARNSGRGVNTNLDEQVVGLSADGLEMNVYLDHIDRFGDLYTSVRRDSSSDFMKPKKLDEIVNEKIETSGCFSNDGQLMVFARRDDMRDNSDLYMCRKLPNGKWGVPTRLSDTINTPFNEDCPFLSFDGETLYFASEGHQSIGGYDLFKSNWDQQKNTFSKPENLGYPINSTDDDRSICVTKDKRMAYISAFRPNGFGDLDIYRVKFNQAEPLIALYTGQVYMGDTIPKNQPKSYAVNIIVTDKQSNYEYSFVPHPRTGRFVMALPAGSYELLTQAKGFERHTEELTITDIGKQRDVQVKNILLKRLPKPAKPKTKKP